MKAPAFQFYPDDFIAGTTEMTPAEVGAYIRLLCYQWGRGAIPLGDKARLARIAGGEVSPDVLAKFPDGCNRRMEVVRAALEAHRAAAAANGARGAAKRWSPQPSTSSSRRPESATVSPFVGDGPAMVSPSDTDSHPIVSPSLQNSHPIISPSDTDSHPIVSPLANSMAKNGSPSPSPSPTLDPNSRSVPVGRAGSAALPDADWLASLKSDPAYAEIDVEREAAKCARWCLTARKVCSRRRVVNWLNRCERPLNGLAHRRPPMMR